jgi:hypothetical protein
MAPVHPPIRAYAVTAACFRPREWNVPADRIGGAHSPTSLAAPRPDQALIMRPTILGNVTLLLNRIRREVEAARPAEGRAASLAESWNAVGADMRRAIARHPDMRGELTAASTAVEKALKDGKLDEVDKLIDDLFGLADAQLKF